MGLKEAEGGGGEKDAKTWGWWVKILGTLGLLGFVLSRMDWGSFGSVLAGVIPVWTLAALLLYILVLLIGGWKWRITMAGWGVVGMTFPQIYRWLLIGQFLSNVMPGVAGQDVARLYGSYQHSGRLGDSLASLMYDRITGLLGLLLVGSGGLFLASRIRETTLFWLAILVAFGVILLFVLMVHWSWLVGILQRLSKRLPGEWGEKMMRLAGLLRLDHARRRVFFAGVGIGLFLQAVNALVYWSSAQALGVEIAMAEAGLFLCLVQLLMAIPISLNGVGLREAASVLFFRQVGLAPEQAVAVTLLYFAIFFLVSLAGGVALARGAVRLETLTHWRGG